MDENNSVKTRKGSIEGFVTIKSKPIANATVMITGNSPPHIDISPLTDDLGKYGFDNLIEGEYSIMVNIENHDAKIKKINVVDGKLSKLNFSFDED